MMFFSTVPGLNFDMCMISARIKTIYALEIIHIELSATKSQKLKHFQKIIITSKSKQDYYCVLEAVRDNKGVVADFESSLWQTVNIVFPNLKIHGCIPLDSSCLAESSVTRTVNIL